MLEYYIDGELVSFNNIEAKLREKLVNSSDPTIALHADEKIDLAEAVKVMNIANKNKYKMIIATRPE